MRILSWLDLASDHRLRAVAAGTDVIVSTATPVAFSESAANGPFDVVVLDPAFGGSGRPTDRDRFAVTAFLRDVRTAIASAIVYAELSEATMRSAIVLASYYPVGVVCRGQPDEEVQLRACLRRFRTHTPARLAILLDRYLSEQTGRSHLLRGESLRLAVTTVILDSSRMRRVSDVASAAACGERSLQRLVGVTGLAGAKRLLLAARIARAHQRLTMDRVRIAQLAREIGFASARGLREATVRCVGVTPSELKSVSSQALANCLFAWLTTGRRADVREAVWPKNDAGQRLSPVKKADAV